VTVSEHQQLLDWLRRLQTITAVALIAYQAGMGVATLTAPERVFSPTVWRTLLAWAPARSFGIALIMFAVVSAVSIARQSRRILDFAIMAQSGIWASWSVSLVWDAAAGHNWSISGAFGYGFMALIGLSVISPLTVGPANQHDG
jgi:hypothetical protein